MKGYN